jgi:acetyl-CoA carboxylase biotin carboxylase subunit
MDLVFEQLRVAAGQGLSRKQDDVKLAGHAIECRICAENPQTFRPSPGQITNFHPPGGVGVRIDSHAYHGYRVPPYYDSLIAKLIITGTTREEAMNRLARALDEFVIDGIETTIPLFKDLVRQPDIRRGAYDIHWLEKHLGLK